jgi:hypothetical protein
MKSTDFDALDLSLLRQLQRGLNEPADAGWSSLLAGMAS